MSQTGKTCAGERIRSYVCSSVKSTGGTFRPVSAAVGLLLLLSAGAALAQSEAPRSARPAMVRQVQRAEVVYRIDNPVQLEETIVRVEIRSPEDMDRWWRFLRVTESESPGNVNIQEALQALEELGGATVLHGGVCLLSDKEESYIHSSKTLPAQTTKVSDGKAVAAVEYRELGRRLGGRFDGVDGQGRICFSYNIELNYIVDKEDKADPAFATFNAEGRAKVKDGATLVIPNFDGSSGLLIFLTPRIVK